MRFSKRECVLLTVLAVLLIWSVGRSRILEPAMERRMSAREECSRLERERIEAEQFIVHRRGDCVGANFGGKRGPVLL